MYKQKTAAAIHDISGLGKCSLTAAIPILSAAGISVGVLPTALLSTQTGGLNNYTYLDLTPQMRTIMSHWEKIGIKFDAVYSGFLGSSEQVDIVLEFVKKFGNPNCIFLCDPAMADNGNLYNTFDASFVDSMKKLCCAADIIVPNFTEAAFLLDEKYYEPSYQEDYVVRVIKTLSERFSVNNVVLTGVSLDYDLVGAAAYDAVSDKISYSLRPRISGMFHSTGDLFASSLLGGILNGFSINDSCEKAIDFTVSAIAQTVSDGGDSRFGLSFERTLPKYIKSLELM